jgi:hypothetical protein
MVAAHLLKLMNSIERLVRVKIDLKHKMNETCRRIDKDTATIKHLRVRCLSHRSKKAALGSTYEVVERDVLSSKEIVFLKRSLMILHHT